MNLKGLSARAAFVLTLSASLITAAGRAAQAADASTPNDCTSKHAFADAWSSFNQSLDLIDMLPLRTAMQATPDPVFGHAQNVWDNEVNVQTVMFQGLNRVCPQYCRDCSPEQAQVCREYQACLGPLDDSIKAVQNYMKVEQGYVARSGPHPGYKDCASPKTCGGSNCAFDLQMAFDQQDKAVALLKQRAAHFQQESACSNPAFADIAAWQVKAANDELAELSKPTPFSSLVLKFDQSDKDLSAFNALRTSKNIIPADRNYVYMVPVPHDSKLYSAGANLLTSPKFTLSEKAAGAGYLGAACKESETIVGLFNGVASRCGR